MVAVGQIIRAGQAIHRAFTNDGPQGFLSRNIFPDAALPSADIGVSNLTAVFSNVMGMIPGMQETLTQALGR